MELKLMIVKKKRETKLLDFNEHLWNNRLRKNAPCFLFSYVNALCSLIPNSKLRISLVPFAKAFHFSGQCQTDIDKTASARSWKDVQPIRGAKHVM